jgi:hypothetical protein
MAMFDNPFRASDTGNVATQNGQQNRPGQQQSPITQQPQQNQTQQALERGGDNSNTIVPDDPNRTNTGDTTGTGDGNSSRANFDKLWDNDPALGADGKPLPASQKQTYLPKLDPAKASELFSRLDFTKGIKPEQYEAIKAGGDAAATALPAILNSQGQEIAKTMFNAITGMMEQGFSTAEGRFLEKVPGLTTGLLADHGLQQNPVMAAPKHKPLVDSVRNQIQGKNPRATPKQIETMVSQYFDDMAQDLTGQNKNNQTSQDGGAINPNSPTGKGDSTWEDWLQT